MDHFRRGHVWQNDFRSGGVCTKSSPLRTRGEARRRLNWKLWCPVYKGFVDSVSVRHTRGHTRY